MAKKPPKGMMEMTNSTQPMPKIKASKGKKSPPKKGFKMFRRKAP